MIRTVYKEQLPLLFLLVVASGVWLTTCGYGFLNYDDGLNVYRNYLVLNGTLANFIQLWLAPVEGLYVPLTYSLWMILAKLSLLFPSGEGFPLNPFLFHAANVVGHLGASTFVYLILKRLAGSGWAALGGALLFALHPLQVEAVAWVTGLKDVCSGFWAMASIYCYVRHAGGGGKGEGLSLAYGLAAAAFILALLAKPGAAAVPVMAGVMAIFLLKRPWRRVGLELAPWLLAVVPVFILTAQSQAETNLRFLPVFWQRLLVAGDALSFYLYKFLWPFPLGPDYGRAPEFVLAHSWSFFTGLAPFLGLGLILWRGRQPGLVAAFLLPAAALLPVLGLHSFSHQTISTVADRYLYSGMIGPALGLAYLLAGEKRKPAAVLASLALFLWLLLTVNQQRYWRDSFVFNEHALEVNPGSWVAYNNLGEALAMAGRYAEAIPRFAKVGEINPGHYRSYWNQGMAYEYLGQSEEALALYRRAIAIEPGFAEGYNSIGALYLDRGEFGAAAGNFVEALRLNPGLIEVHGNLGMAFLALKQYGEAEHEFQWLLANDPGSFLAENGLAEVLRAQGRRAEAISHYRAALAINPGFTPASNSLRELLSAPGIAPESGGAPADRR